eukprot:scaffold39196_cov62-Phaeocystis_antarctica.AAC.2
MQNTRPKEPVREALLWTLYDTLHLLSAAVEQMGVAEAKVAVATAEATVVAGSTQSGCPTA